MVAVKVLGLYCTSSRTLLTHMFIMTFLASFSNMMNYAGIFVPLVFKISGSTSLLLAIQASCAKTVPTSSHNLASLSKE